MRHRGELDRWTVGRLMCRSGLWTRALFSSTSRVCPKAVDDRPVHGRFSMGVTKDAGADVAGVSAGTSTWNHLSRLRGSRNRSPDECSSRRACTAAERACLARAHQGGAGPAPNQDYAVSSNNQDHYGTEGVGRTVLPGSIVSVSPFSTSGRFGRYRICASSN